MRSIMAVVADAERINSVARLERGKRHRIERGHLPGMPHPKYGYRWVDDEPGKRTAYEEDPQTAPTVRMIFALAKAGHSLRGIARLLNAEGVPTPARAAAANGQLGRGRSGAGWVAEQVRRILTDRAYIGELVAYSVQSVRSEQTGRVRRVLRPVSDNKRIALAVPALVDGPTFAAVQHHRHARGRPPADGEATWLRGYVYCGVCGQRMQPWREAGGAYIYACRNRRGTATVNECAGGAFSIRAHRLDPYACNDLAKMVGMPEPYPLRALMLKRLGTDKTEHLAVLAEGYAAQLAEKREELETARRRARQTRDDTLAAQFIADAERLTADIRTLEADYAEARAERDSSESGSAWVDTVLARIRACLPADDLQPTAADIRGWPLDIRRLLLANTGLYLAVYPQGWRADGKRVVVQHYWVVTPEKLARTCQERDTGAGGVAGGRELDERDLCAPLASADEKGQG